MPQRIGNDLCSENTKFYGNWVLFFLVEAFQFSKFHEEVVKLNKSNFKRNLTDIHSQKFVKLLGKMAENFASLFLLRVITQTVYKFSKI